MKKWTMMALLALSAIGAGAQTAYEATSIAQKDLNGTARFVGMGGAMSALGGDISTMGTNPAGIGIYRSSDAMVTFGYSLTGTESKYDGNKFDNDKGRWNFDNAGVVIATKIGNYTPLRYVNFGFNYHKSKSFYKNMTMSGLMGTFNGTYLSQVWEMAQQATDAQSVLYQYYNGQQLDFGSSAIYTDDEAGWLGALGYQGWLTDEYSSSTSYTYAPRDLSGEADLYYRSRERGGIDEYDFNIAFNVNDRFYFGVTFGAYDVDYHKYSVHDEIYVDSDGDQVGAGYALHSFNRVEGWGFDVKFGAIIRPIATSPLRIGLSVHTPTYYNLTYTTRAALESSEATIDTRSMMNGRSMERDFDLNTPWVFNASLGYTVGNYLALGAEYEYEDYASMKFKYPEGGHEMSFENEIVDANMKGVSTIRVGAEYKPITSFAIRAGYNFSTAAYKSEAFKELPSNSINTDTDFSNSKSMNTFTLGIGYRKDIFYADLAYKFDIYKADFYPFYNVIDDYVVTPSATEVTTTRSKVLLTLGVRF